MVISDFYFVQFNMKDPAGCHPTWCQHSLINYLVLFFSLTSTASTASSSASQNAARLHTLPSSVSIIQTPTATAVTSTVANKVASTLQQSARSTPSPAGSASGNAAATAKKVIDIVDLSDEDEDQPKYEIFIRKNSFLFVSWELEWEYRFTISWNHFWNSILILFLSTLLLCRIKINLSMKF